jgi:hypothetical protein
VKAVKAPRRAVAEIQAPSEDPPNPSRRRSRIRLVSGSGDGFGDVRVAEQDDVEANTPLTRDAQLTQRIRKRIKSGDPAVHEYMFEAQDWQFVIDADAERRTITRNLVGRSGTFERITYPESTTEFEIAMDVRHIARNVNANDFKEFERGFTDRNPSLYPAQIYAIAEPGTVEAMRLQANREEAYTVWMRGMGATDEEINMKWWRETVYNTLQPDGYMNQAVAAVAAASVAVRGGNILNNGLTDHGYATASQTGPRLNPASSTQTMQYATDYGQRAQPPVPKSLSVGKMVPAGVPAPVRTARPGDIAFSQRTVGENVAQYVDDMKNNRWDWSKSGPINVMRQGDRYVTFDNRRLLAARESGLPEIPINVVDPKAIRPGTKMTWEEAFRRRFNDPRNKSAGGVVPEGGLIGRPAIVPKK